MASLDYTEESIRKKRQFCEELEWNCQTDLYCFSFIEDTDKINVIFYLRSAILTPFNPLK